MTNNASQRWTARLFESHFRPTFMFEMSCSLINVKLARSKLCLLYEKNSENSFSMCPVLRVTQTVLWNKRFDASAASCSSGAEDIRVFHPRGWPLHFYVKMSSSVTNLVNCTRATHTGDPWNWVGMKYTSNLVPTCSNAEQQKKRTNVALLIACGVLWNDCFLASHLEPSRLYDTDKLKEMGKTVKFINGLNTRYYGIVNGFCL